MRLVPTQCAIADASLTQPIARSGRVLHLAMTIHRALAALALSVLAQLLPAQYFVPDQKLLRATTRVSWHGLSGEQALAIDHGQPKWNAGYEQLLTGRTVLDARLGSGAWTTLQAGVAMTFGTTRVPAGRWYLGLRRDAEQNVSLTFLLADPLDQRGVGAFATSTLEPDFVVALSRSRSEQSVERLDLTLAAQRTGKENVLLTIAWGPHRLSTGLVADFDRRVPEGAPEFVLPEPKDLVTTASGLQYQVLRRGAGAFATASDRVTMHYCGWLSDGRQFQSSYLGGEAPTLAMDQVEKGFAEGLRLMQPGAVFRLVIPPALAHGSAGVGDVIPPDATLVFTVHLLAIVE